VRLGKVSGRGTGWRRPKMMKRTNKGQRPLLMSLLLLSLGIILLWAVRYWINDPATAMGDAVFVSVLIMPILFYAIISGNLTELRGPGGVGAIFNTVATAPVSGTIALDPVSVEEDSQILTEGGVEALEERVRKLDENRPSAMTVTFGGRKYTPEALLGYVEALWRSRSFKLVVFLDRDGRFVAYMPAWAVKNMLSAPATSREFVRFLNEGNHELLAYPGLVRKTISIRSTNADALREMNAKNIEALVVTDEDNRLKGIAEREQVLTKMMLDLTQ
jgi:CBS domain-containing protein